MTCGTTGEAVTEAAHTEFDVALIDFGIGTGEPGGVELALAVRALAPGIPIVISTAHPQRIDVLRPPGGCGSWSVVRKGDQLNEARLESVIERTVAGWPTVADAAVLRGGEPTPLDRLSLRQRQVMSLAAMGWDAKAIAARLHLAHVSVRRDLSLAYRALVPSPDPGTHLRTAAVLSHLRLRNGSA